MSPVARLLKAWLPGRQPPAAVSRPRQFHAVRPDRVYAVGDPHGRLDLYAALEEDLADDAARRGGSAVLVVLGNIVDRGPQAAALVERLIAPPPPPLTRIVLAGNHEQAMLDFLARPAPDHGWLSFGGMQTLLSYGIDRLPESRHRMARLLSRAVPETHRRFLAGLPSIVTFPGLVLVHAGVDQDRTPDMQPEDTLLWSRPDPARDRGYRGQLLVHGHTPVVSVEIVGERINVDTGACFSGKLSAVRIDRDDTIRVFEHAG